MRRVPYALSIAVAVSGLSIPAYAEAPPPVPEVPATAKSVTPAPGKNVSIWEVKRHEYLDKQAAAGGFDVMFVGDSISQNWEYFGYDIWTQEMVPLKAANFGVHGDRTENVLWRFTHGNLEGALKPRVMVLMIGTNNTGLRQDKPEEIAAGVGAIVKVFHERFPAAKILLLAIFPRGETPASPMRMNNEAANKLLAGFDGYWNIRYLDINAKFLAADGTLSKEIMPDLLHPNAKGYRIWADAIIPEIKAALAAR